MTPDLYKIQALSILQDFNTYKKLDVDPTPTIKGKLEVLLTESLALEAITEKDLKKMPVT